MNFFKNIFILKKINFIIFEDFLKKFNNLFLFFIFFLFILSLFFVILILNLDIIVDIEDDRDLGIDMYFYKLLHYSFFFLNDKDDSLLFLNVYMHDEDLFFLAICKIMQVFKVLLNFKFDLFMIIDLENLENISFFDAILIEIYISLNILNILYILFAFSFKILMYVLIIHIFSYFDNFIYDYFKEFNIFKNIMKLLFFFIIIFLDYIIILI